MLIAASTPVTEVQALLGHSNPQTSLRVYSHWFGDVETKSVETLASALLAQGGHPVDTLDTSPEEPAVGADENVLIPKENLAPPAGFEPTAPGLGILCSIHLS
jgi:hypothetical protein